MKRKAAAAVLVIFAIFCAGMLCVSAEPLDIPPEVPEEAYFVESGFEELTENGIVHWYSSAQAEEGLTVTAAEGYLVSAEYPEIPPAEDGEGGENVGDPGGGEEPTAGEEPTEDPLAEFFAEECKVPIADGKMVFYVLLPDRQIGTVVLEDRKIDEKAPEVQLLMGGEADPDGSYYYRAANCGITMDLTDEGPAVTAENMNIRVKIGGVICEPEKTVKDGKMELSIRPETVAGRGDGVLSVTVLAADAVGNETAEIEVKGSRGAVVKEGAASFILDTVSPVCRFTINPGKREVNGRSASAGAYYFRYGYTAEALIQDTNADPSRFRVMRGKWEEEKQNARSEEIIDFSERIPVSEPNAGSKLNIASEPNAGSKPNIASEPNAASGPVRFTDKVEDKGVYRYEIYGTDQAGNPLVMEKSEAMENGTNRSRHIILDKTAPEITITAGAGENGGNPAAGRDSEGRPLFATDVRFRIRAEDLWGKKGSSGVAEVSYELFRGGSLAAEGSLWKMRAERPDGPAIPSIYEVTERLRVPAEDYEANALQLTVHVKDRSGNAAESSYAFGIDRTAPKILVRLAGGEAKNELYFASERTARITVYEKNFDPSGIRTEIRKNLPPEGENAEFRENPPPEGGSVENEILRWTEVPSGEGRAWQADIPFAEDGEYTFSVSGRDLAGNSAGDIIYEGEAARHFVIDRTPPAVQVSYGGGNARNGIFYQNGRTAHISVSDAHFGGEHHLTIRISEKESGNPADGNGGSTDEKPVDAVFVQNETEVSFPGDGTFSLGGTVTDLAGNVSEPLAENWFTIDQTPPVILVEGVRAWSANREPVKIRIRMKDAHPDPGSLSAALTALHAETEDVFSWEKDSGEKDAFSLEKDSGEKDFLSRREAFASGTDPETGEYILDLPAVTADDIYALTARTADLAGNMASAAVTFSENQKGTVFAFEQKEVQGKYAPKGIRPSFLLWNVDEIIVLSVTVNGSEVPYSMEENRLVLRDLLTEDGKYVIGIETSDAAGNRSSMDPVEFFIDTQAPVIRMEGLKSGQQEYTEEFTITLSTEREEDFFRYVKLDGILLFGEENGETVRMSDAEAFSGRKYGFRENGALYITVNEYGEHTLEMQASDPAGNAGDAETHRFVLQKAVLERWTGEKPDHRLLYIITFMIPGAAAVPAAGWIRRRRKNKK